MYGLSFRNTRMCASVYLCVSVCARALSVCVCVRTNIHTYRQAVSYTRVKTGNNNLVMFSSKVNRRTFPERVSQLFLVCIFSSLSAFDVLYTIACRHLH